MKVTRKSKWMLSILFVFLLPSHLFSQAASMPMEAPTEGEPVTEVQEDETDEGGNRTIKGIIYDEQGETIIGASVLIKGEETTGTTSDMDGKFTLSVPQGSTLVISYIGYHPQEIKIRKRTALHVILKEDNQLLEEVVVVGYGLRFRCVDQAIQEPAGKTGGKHPSRPDTRCGSYCDKRCARSRHESTCTRYYLYQ